MRHYICNACNKRFESRQYKPKYCSLKCRDDVRLRFFPQIEKQSSGCWIWTGLKDKNGYGTLVHTVDGKKEQRAHRISWIIHNGKIPEGSLVCHHCDNPPCVNPAHLFLGSNLDNMLDKTAKGRNNPPVGERAGHAILMASEVKLIRFLHATGKITQRKLAEIYGVGYKAICKIVHRQRWAHV